MTDTYEKHLAKIEAEAMREGIADFRVAREEFNHATGLFEDGEPWYELRMAMFLDWYLLERPGPSGMTPVERYLTAHGDQMDPETFREIEHLTVTLRSVFLIRKKRGESLLLEDMSRGGMWLVTSSAPTVGLERDDIIGARIAHVGGQPTIGRGIVLHPREAREAVLGIMARARREGMLPVELTNHLDKMRLKLDRYSNVRLQHVYRYPGDAQL